MLTRIASRLRSKTLTAYLFNYSKREKIKICCHEGVGFCFIYFGVVFIFLRVVNGRKNKKKKLGVIVIYCKKIN